MNRDQFWLTEATILEDRGKSADRYARQGSRRRQARHQRHCARTEIWRSVSRCTLGLRAEEDSINGTCAGRRKACGQSFSRRWPKLVDRRRRFLSTPPPSRRTSRRREGAKSGDRPIARWSHDEDPRANRRPMSTARLHAHRRRYRRLHRWRSFSRTVARMRNPARRQGLRRQCDRRQVEERGAMPDIQPRANRKWKNCFSPFLYRNRNAIERMFCRLDDVRRLATRYDRNAVNFLATVCIAPTVSYWL